MDTILKSAKLMTVLEAVGLFIVCYIAIKLLRKAIDKILDRSKHLDPSLKTFFASAVNVLLWAIAVMIVASALGINITSLVAILSVAGVALSLALQGLLANVFSGITLLASRPIAVGNFVEIGGQSGTVRSIGLFYTCLATPDNKIIYVPNGDITGSKIINYSTEPVRRVDLNVGTSYDCPTETVRAAILEAVANTDKTVETNRVLTVFSKEKPFALSNGWFPAAWQWKDFYMAWARTLFLMPQDEKVRACLYADDYGQVYLDGEEWFERAQCKTVWTTRTLARGFHALDIFYGELAWNSDASLWDH